MKKLRIAALAGVTALTLTGAVLAQASSEVAVTRAQIQADRQAIVADNMKLTEEQSQAFWPVYREYRAEMALVGDRLFKVISDYATSYETLTDPQASALVKEFLTLQRDSVKVREKYASRFEKVLPAKGVMRFFQIENKLDAIIMIDVVASIPLAK
jgi:hypothetical protein